MHTVLLRPYYWLTRFTVRRSPGISYPGYSILTLYRVTLYLFSMVTLSGLSYGLLYGLSSMPSLWSTLCRTLAAYLFPSSLPSGLPPLQIRHKANP